METTTGDEFDEELWLKAAASNPAFDFLNDPEEDIYTLADGKPSKMRNTGKEGNKGYEAE